MSKSKYTKGSDPGDLLQRVLSLLEGNISKLEEDFEEGVRRGLIPEGHANKITALAKSLNDVTLSWARYRKSEKEWADRQTPEEVFEWIVSWLERQWVDRPHLARSFMHKAVKLAVQEDTSRQARKNAEAVAASEEGSEDVTWEV